MKFATEKDIANFALGKSDVIKLLQATNPADLNVARHSDRPVRELTIASIVEVLFKDVVNLNLIVLNQELPHPPPYREHFEEQVKRKNNLLDAIKLTPEEDIGISFLSNTLNVTDTFLNKNMLSGIRITFYDTKYLDYVESGGIVLHAEDIPEPANNYSIL